VAEKVRSKAAKLRRDERLGNNSDGRGGNYINDIKEEGRECSDGG
jgi:hypothetical protein